MHCYFKKDPDCMQTSTNVHKAMGHNGISLLNVAYNHGNLLLLTELMDSRLSGFG